MPKTFGASARIIFSKEKSMKKLTAIALLAAAMSFVACSSTEEKKAEAPAEAPKAEVAAPAPAPAPAPAKAPAKKKK